MSRNKARKVIVSHGYDAQHWPRHSRFPWGLRQWFRGWPYVRRLPRMLRSFDHVVFLSPRVDRHRFFDHRTLSRCGGPPWTAIPNGTWPEAFAARRTDFRAQHGLGDAFVILFVGLYAPNKNQEAALNAFGQASLSNATLVFIGNALNDYTRHLQRVAASLPGDHRQRVLFLEKQDREAIRAAYQAADLVLLTSKAETQPLVLLDAMACGKPFLSTDVGCVSELPGGVVVRHVNELAGALRQLYLDEKRRATLGRAGLAAAQKEYHWNTVLDAYEQLFRNCVEAR